ncbi:hypothetical protein [Clostridium weizhouense]|uniref:Uncharacterized protein n=1 Tax=Clostridium weizhouense TaxID=2859781 RepID=A0ABS7ARV3_9CLOT|nr:hypothetical protein [Clostridium weizhouense]MBW6411398.1 hypothetical protein [Clostridium weizhouense]
MYCKFPDEFLVPIVSADDVIESNEISNLKRNTLDIELTKSEKDNFDMELKKMYRESCIMEEEVSKSCNKNDKKINMKSDSIEEGLKDVEIKSIWSEVDEDYANSQSEN